LNPSSPANESPSDAVEDFHREAKMLVDAMLEANALELLVQRLLSLDEKASCSADDCFSKAN